MVKKINVALIGYKFMGKAHSRAYRDAGMFFNPSAQPVLKVLCGRTEKDLKAAAAKFGWQEYETSWEKVVAREDIDLVDISTPPGMHAPIAIAAAKAGKHIFCEKPLALTLKDGKAMLDAANRAGVMHMIGFNYRRVPAIVLAKKLIDEGKIGKIYHFRAVYLQDWIVDPDFPLNWRLEKEHAGSGALGDLGAHLIDLCRYLICDKTGEIDSVVGITETFIKERPRSTTSDGITSAAKAEGRGKVTVDDAALFLARFTKSDTLASFEATRFANGHKNTNCIEINGSDGSLIFNLERLNELQFFSRKDPDCARGFRTILVTEPGHPYISGWWPPGHTIGWEHTFVHEVVDLMDCIAKRRMPQPNFEDGYRCQLVLDAVERSVKEGKWVKVSG